MSKYLPYFKFEPGQWDTGNIQMCSRVSKGLFIDLCSLYWSRLGELPYALALQKLCNGDKDALQELLNNDILIVNNGFIIIEFLDEQLEEFQETSKKRAKAANKRWSDASELQVDSKSNARREEKRRGDKKKEEKKKRETIENNFEGDLKTAWDEWVIYRKEKKATLTPSTVKKQMKFLGARDPSESIAIINQSITNGWTGLFELKNGNKRTTTKETIRRADAIIPTGTDWGKF